MVKVFYCSLIIIWEDVCFYPMLIMCKFTILSAFNKIINKKNVENNTFLTIIRQISYKNSSKPIK